METDHIEDIIIGKNNIKRWFPVTLYKYYLSSTLDN